MIYLKKFNLPGEDAEYGVIMRENRTCFASLYPFGLFARKGLDAISFDGITMLYGGNGSGKSTLINVISEKVGAVRYAEFNNSPFFDQYVGMCRAEYFRRPYKSYVLTSDDVFDYVLNARSINERIDDRREELFRKYAEVHKEAEDKPDTRWLKGLDDYDRWKETTDILSKRKSQSQYVKSRIARDIDLHSNGETAMRYFVERIDEDALYFLDEPENSLSVEFQIELVDYISATARATRSQFIIATHSPVFLGMRGAEVYNLDSEPVERCNWTELPNVRKYFDFFMERREEFK